MRALRELGMKADLTAAQPTTAGLIATLSAQSLTGHRVAVQLYGTLPNTPLCEFLVHAGATVRTVAPYVYAPAADDAAVQGLLAELGAGRVDAIAFTSTPQVERLFSAAPVERVRAVLARTLVAAVGPVVAAALARHGVRRAPDARGLVLPQAADQRAGAGAGGARLRRIGVAAICASLGTRAARTRAHGTE